MMTRNFVELFLKKLYLKIYQLGVQNDTRTYSVQLNGDWVEMSPSQWPMRTQMSVVTAMTPSASVQSAMNKIAVHNMLMQDPDAMLMYPDYKRYSMYSEIIKELGEVAVDRFLENPQSQEYKAAQMNMLQGQQQQAQRAERMQMRQEAIVDKQIQLQEATVDQGQQKIDNDAIYNAGLSRFRAIFLTTITTVAGLAPLIFETSFQAQFLIPMAVSIAYGIGFATMLTLVVLPSLMALVNDARVNIVHLRTRERPSRESVEPAIKEMKGEAYFNEMHKHENDEK